MPHSFRLGLLGALAIAAVASLGWGAVHALRSSDDLERRIEEVELVLRRVDPYLDPDMTYPPSAVPVFTAVLGPLESAWRRPVWLGVNLAFLAALAWQVVGLVRGRETSPEGFEGNESGTPLGSYWPIWVCWALGMFVVACRPARMGLALGQFHVIPMVAVLAAWASAKQGRPTKSGLWMALALVKPSMSVPFLGLFGARRHWRVIVVAGFVHLALWLATSWWLGKAPWDLAREWLALAAVQQAQGSVDLGTWILHVWPDAGRAASVTGAGLLVLGLLFLFHWQRLGVCDEVRLAWCGLLAAVFTYHRAYDLVLLLPATAWLVDRAWHLRPGATRVLVRASAALLLIFLVVPSHPAVAGWLDPYFLPGITLATWMALGTMAVAAGRGQRVRGGVTLISHQTNSPGPSEGRDRAEIGNARRTELDDADQAQEKVTGASTATGFMRRSSSELTVRLKS